jgi:hypothetical protein
MLYKSAFETLQLGSEEFRNLPGPEVLSAWARLVDESMSSEARSYHTTSHVLDVVAALPKHNNDPILLLAALFHDVVYLTVDRHLSTDQQALVGTIIRDPSGEKENLEFVEHREDGLLLLVRDIFEVGNTNESVGLNEYLSAVVAVQMLGEYVTSAEIFQIGACIEASIPVRPNTCNGYVVRSPMQVLHDRLLLVNRKWGLGFSSHELTKTTQRAVKFALADLISFH